MHALPVSLAIFALGFLTMFFGTATGGVGLVIVPLLMTFGLPPHAAIATTRFSVFAGDLVGLRVFQKAGKVEYALALPVLLLGLTGSVFGSFVLLWTPGAIVEKLLGAFLLLMLLFMLKQNSIGLQPVHIPSTVRRLFGYVLLFLVSIFGAFFSAASGLLGRTTLMTCFGQTYLQSAATRKIQGIGIGIVSLIIFAWGGIIHLPTVALLAPAMIFGSFFGSRFALHKGEKWVKALFCVVVLIAGLHLLLF